MKHTNYQVFEPIGTLTLNSENPYNLGVANPLGSYHSLKQKQKHLIEINTQSGSKL